MIIDIKTHSIYTHKLVVNIPGQGYTCFQPHILIWWSCIYLQDIPSTTKVHMWTRVTPGPHNMYHIDPSVTFMALVSGTYQVNSYAFAAGLRLARINAVSCLKPRRGWWYARC